MNHHLTVNILGIKPLSHSGNDHNREFQSFTFVNTHQTYSVPHLIACVGLAVIHLVFPELLYIAKEMKQSFVAGALVGLRLFNQHIQICSSLYASRQSQYIVPVSGHRDNRLQ